MNNLLSNGYRKYPCLNYSINFSQRWIYSLHSSGIYREMGGISQKILSAVLSDTPHWNFRLIFVYSISHSQQRKCICFTHVPIFICMLVWSVRLLMYLYFLNKLTYLLTANLFSFIIDMDIFRRYLSQSSDVGEDAGANVVSVLLQFCLIHAPLGMRLSFFYIYFRLRLLLNVYKQLLGLRTDVIPCVALRLSPSDTA